MRAPVAVSLAVVAMLFASGCKKKTDAERAAKERAEIQEMLEKSWALLPYRWLKVAVRSKADAAVMKPLQDVQAALAETEKVSADLDGLEQAAKMTLAYAKLAKSLYDAREELSKRDEDTYPLVWTVWTGEPAPFAWYDNGAEHLGLAGFWVVTAFAAAHAGGDKLPVKPVVFYELSRAEVRDSWPMPLQLVGLLTRGIAFTGTTYHYAAEEELDRYLGRLDAVTPLERALLAELGKSLRRDNPEQPLDLVAAAQAAGHFVRAWNRMALDRDEGATDDVEKGLAALQRLGIENELTHWGWTFVHAKRGQMQQAGASLAKLAESPHLDDDTRADLRDEARRLSEQGDASGFFGVFGKGKAALILGRALFARAGGLHGVLHALLGPQRAVVIEERLDWMQKTRDGVTQHLSLQGGVDAAKDLGSKGIDALKQRLAEPEPSGAD